MKFKDENDNEGLTHSQCEFQFMGRRCQLSKEACSWSHKIKSKFCEFHWREEYIKDCEYLKYKENK